MATIDEPRTPECIVNTGSPSDEAVRVATGRGWSDWHTVLQRMGASALPHREIAARLQGEHGVAAWWAQTITVEYERAIGRRAVGQRCDGEFDVGASKTLTGTPDDAFLAWTRLAAGRTEFDGVALVGAPRISRTRKWRYWRADLADGSRLAIVVGGKPGTTPKAGVAVNHEGIATKDAADRWKSFWKAFLPQLD